MKLSFNIYLHWINKLNIWPWTSIKRRSRLLWLNLLRASAANITVIFVKIEDGATVLSLCLFLCLPVRQEKEENKNWKKKKAGKLQKRNKKKKKLKKRYNVSRWQVSEVGHCLKTRKASGALTRWISSHLQDIPSTQHPKFSFFSSLLFSNFFLFFFFFFDGIIRSGLKIHLIHVGGWEWSFPLLVTININNGTSHSLSLVFDFFVCYCSLHVEFVVPHRSIGNRSSELLNSNASARHFQLEWIQLLSNWVEQYPGFFYYSKFQVSSVVAVI